MDGPLAVLTFVAPPALFTIYVALTEFEFLNSKNAKIFGILPTIIIGFIPAFLYLYFYVPFIAVYHGIQGFCKDKLESVECFSDIDDPRDIQFLKIFEQFGEALPQFMLGLTFYPSIPMTTFLIQFSQLHFYLRFSLELAFSWALFLVW